MRSATAWRRRTAVASLAAALCGPAAAVDHERAGDVLENALPAGAAALELWRGDRDGALQLGGAFVVTLLATRALKSEVHVRRPDGSSDDSFPSGHAARAFSAATYMHRRHGWAEAWPWYAAAGYVGWTRVNANRHRWGDVAGSLALAAASSWWLVEPRADQRVVVLPVIGHREASLTLQARW